MSAANNIYDNQNDCVLISDEDDEEVQEYRSTAATTAATASTSTAAASSSSASMKPAAPRPISTRVYSDDTNVSYEETDGRRVSRRRKNRNADSNDGRSNGSGNDHTNDNNKANPSTSFVKEDKKLTPAENRETRSRKRERSPTPPPPPADVKENESLAYKEILSGLEGAAFQSRFVVLYDTFIGKSKT